jgi:hypothetical protein
VPTYQNLSYEVDDSTAISTLQLWMKRDTGLPVEQQELLLPSGQPFDATKEACQCWVPPAPHNQVSVYHYASIELTDMSARNS